MISAAITDTAPVRTTCPYCGVGCGVLAQAGTHGDITIQGDPEHPANLGRLCAKGLTLGDTVGLEGRLLYPHIADQRVAWETALDHVATSFQAIIDRHGPDAVAFYVSGQLLTEDYYVANKLMKGFIGSGNIDTNSRLCMSSTVAAQKRAFGEDVVPGCYEDLELAELIVLVGSNTAWCHPVLYRRMADAKARHANLQVVAIDPRRTAACDMANLHLPINPGTDVALFNGLLNYLRRHDGLDFGFLEQHVSGFAATLASAEAMTIPAVAATCGVAEADILDFYRRFARTEKVVTAWSQGVNQSSSGTDKVNAIINVHLATGRIGRPGMGPFSLTGQPNAMGGREVGGLANQLAAHRDFGDVESHRVVAEFWNTDRLATRPGLKAVDLFDAIGSGQVKAVWIMATNPVVSLPDAQAVRRALAACELVVVSDCEDQTDLTGFAHVRLPALAWGEKEGTVTNSERRISRQRAFLPAPGEARPDWWMMAEVARRMGFGAAFGYRSAHDIFCEHARLSALNNGSARCFDLDGLADLNADGYATLGPICWPVTRETPQGTDRLGGDGRFWHTDGKARMLPLTPTPPRHAPSDEFPMILNTGRIRDQWHTMTRTARSTRLNRHTPEPVAELHPTDSDRYAVQNGALTRLRSPWGEALARVKVSTDQKPGSVFMPMHWSDRYAASALVNGLVNPVTDPISGEPELKHTPVIVEPYQPVWHGFLMTRQAGLNPATPWAVRIRGDGFWHFELAGEAVPDKWRNWLDALLGAADPDDEWLEYADPARGRYRCAQIREQRLMTCLFIDRSHELPARGLVADLFLKARLSSPERLGLLAGKPLGVGEDRGKTVCACFNVGATTIQQAIAEGRCQSVDDVTTQLRAGGGCGSCLPEIRAMLEANATRKVS